jgi:hypothetical protein
VKGGPKEAARRVIDYAKAHGQMGTAAAPSDSAKTVLTMNGFHLDRQQPVNEHGVQKVALQEAGKKQKGKPTTVAQVAITGYAPNIDAAGRQVGARLKHSLNTGKEQSIHLEPTKKERNLAAARLAQFAKKQRTDAKLAAGKAKAAAGDFRKGKKN